MALMTRAGADRDKVESALAQAALRLTDKEAAVAPLLKALAGATPENQAALLRVLAQVPSQKSLVALRDAVKSADAGVQDAAMRGLADWPDAAAIPDLAAILRAPSSETHRVLALRGLVRLSSSLAPGPAAQSLAEAMALCRTPAEKKQVLGALTGVPSRGTLELAMSCLGDRTLELEAATATASLARRLQSSEPAASRQAVEKIREVCTLPEARRLADDPRLRLAGLANIASRGTASIPTGWQRTAGPPATRRPSMATRHVLGRGRQREGLSAGCHVCSPGKDLRHQHRRLRAPQFRAEGVRDPMRRQGGQEGRLAPPYDKNSLALPVGVVSARRSS